MGWDVKCYFIIWRVNGNLLKMFLPKTVCTFMMFCFHVIRVNLVIESILSEL